MVNFYTYLELYLRGMDRPINLGEFEKHFKKPHQTIKRYLGSLVKDNVLTVEKQGRFLLYALNKDNPLTYEYLSVCEKEKLFRLLRNPLFKRLYGAVSAHFKDSSILLFGSAAESKDFADMDILILSKDKRITKTLRNFEVTYGRKIHTVLTSEKHLTSSFLREIVKKHVIFNDHDHFVGLLYGKS